MMIGRNREKTSLGRTLCRDEAQFAAIYGRRRVGKTYFVRNFFKDDFAFYHTGLQNGDLKEQLRAFRDSLLRQGYADCPVFDNWLDAFSVLRTFLEKQPQDRKIVFLDELPWMDTPRSKFVMWLGNFWNSWASARKDIVLVVCGSASSWIIGKIVKDRGGLHNRLTNQIYIEPFCLAECEAYCRARGFSFTRTDIAELYMVFGGVPYYWSVLMPGQSVAQNIDRLLFDPNGDLRLEYSQLYASLFKNAARHLAVVEALASKAIGMTRTELVEACGSSFGGTFISVLEELEQCGFIRSYTPPGRKTRGTLFQLMDNFTLFHQRFMSGRSEKDSHFWENSLNTPAVNTWHGFAFERLCLQHVPQIKKALGISGVLTNTYAWRHVPDDVYPTGVQIDLLLDRADRLVNMCEMKWSYEPFAITKEYDARLRTKAGTYSAVATKGRKGVNITLVTPFGVAENMYRFTPHSVVTLDDLFEEVRP